MTVAVPPGRMHSKACSAAFFSPMASNAYSTPPPVISRIVLTGSTLDASTERVLARARRAEITRLRELLLEHVDRDDHAGARDARALDDREADAASAVHRHC